MPQATFLAFLLGVLLLFLPPKGPPTAPSAQLSFPFMQERPAEPLAAFALDYGT